MGSANQLNLELYQSEFVIFSFSDFGIIRLIQEISQIILGIMHKNTKYFVITTRFGVAIMPKEHQRAEIFSKLGGDLSECVNFFNLVDMKHPNYSGLMQ